MRRSFAKLPSPVLAGVVRETTTRAAIAQIKNCQYDGAGMIDLHMSCLEDSSVAEPEKIINISSLFLAEQDFITGQNIVVDGGRSLGPSHR